MSSYGSLASPFQMLIDKMLIERNSNNISGMKDGAMSAIIDSLESVAAAMGSPPVGLTNSVIRTLLKNRKSIDSHFAPSAMADMSRIVNNHSSQVILQPLDLALFLKVLLLILC